LLLFCFFWFAIRQLRAFHSFASMLPSSMRIATATVKVCTDWTRLWRKTPNRTPTNIVCRFEFFSFPLVSPHIWFSLDICSFFRFLSAAFDRSNSSSFSMSFSMVTHLGSSLSYPTGAFVPVVPSSSVIPGTAMVPTSTISLPSIGGNNSTTAPMLKGRTTEIMRSPQISPKASPLHSTIVGTSSPLATLAANSTSLATEDYSDYSDNQSAAPVRVPVCQAVFVVGMILVAVIVAGAIPPW